MAAGSAVIGALRVELGINSAAFDKGLKDTKSKLGALGTFFSKFGKEIAATLSVGGLVLAFKSVVDSADELNKASQKFGVPVEKLSELKFAADLADVSLEALGVGFKKMAKNVQQIAAGGAQDAAEAFRALGISVTDTSGKLKDQDKLFAEVADSFAKYADGANKTALAQAIFGKSGADLIPLLNAGSKGLREAAAEAHTLGVVIGSDTAAQAETFNDNLTRLKTAVTGLFTQVAIKLLPTLVDLTNKFVDLVKEGQPVETMATVLKNSFKEVARFVIEFNAAIAETAVDLKFLKDFTKTNTLSGVAELWKQSAADVEKINQDMQMKIRSLNDETVGNLLAGIDKFVNKQKEAAAATQQDKPDAPLVRTKQQLKDIEEAAKLAKDAMDNIISAGQDTFENTRTPVEALALEMSKLQLQLRAGAIDWDTYQRAVKKANIDILGSVDVIKDMSNALEDSLGSALDNIIDGTFNLQDALFDLLKTLTKVALSDAFQIFNQNQTNAGGTGGILGSIVSSLFGAIPGFASGGSMKVGGSGGIDSKLALMKVTPNEQIDVRKPGQDRTTGFAVPNFIVEDHRRQGTASMEKDPSGDFRLFIRDVVRSVLPGEIKPIMQNQYGVNTLNKRR